MEVEDAQTALHAMARGSANFRQEVVIEALSRSSCAPSPRLEGSSSSTGSSSLQEGFSQWVRVLPTPLSSTSPRSSNVNVSVKLSRNAAET